MDHEIAANAIISGNDINQPIPKEYIEKVKIRMNKGTGPKKLLNLINHSYNGNLALKAYVAGKTWQRASDTNGTAFYLKTSQFFEEITKEAQHYNDQFALEAIKIMRMYFDTGGSTIDLAIHFNAEHGLGFLIQMGELLSIDHLSSTISKEMPHLTRLLLQAGCPVENRLSRMREQPLVIALKKGDEETARMLLPKVDISKKFTYDLEKQPITIPEYLELEYPHDTQEAYQINYDYLKSGYKSKRPERPNYANARSLLEKLNSHSK